jgi:A/G-specific adenine glycosylase
MTPSRFRKLVLAHYDANGRHALPWRKTRDAYRILVSEVMLQQTQVERVIPYYAAFLTRFPDVQVLASAPLADVLRLWQGLGYNRRAKMLHEAAKAVAREHAGRMPATVPELAALPGVGPYTARAVAAFAKNTDVIFVETNIRTAVIHHFFPDAERVPDSDIIAILEKANPKGESRRWYSALMDYGAYLKRSGIRINRKSASYAKQTSFKGSAREVRGAMLRALSEGPKSSRFLIMLLGPDRVEQSRAQLASLAAEGLIEGSRGRFRLPA